MKDGSEQPDQARQAPRPGGRKVVLFNDDTVFSELRAYAQIPHSFIDTGWDFDKDFKAGGGKGGTLMAFIGDAYVVKELSKGDHKTLNKIAGSYANHVRDGETLLCPIYMHFQDCETQRTFMVMRNCIGPGANSALYDLKGCADDKTLERDGEKIPAVHKRIWKVSMWMGTATWTPERHNYYEGKKHAANVAVQVTKEQQEQVIRCVRRDTQWLASQRLMDYSLLVGIRETEPRVTASGGAAGLSVAARPLMRREADGRTVCVFVSIIDFLQRWTNGKRVARCIKVMEQNKATVPPRQYGERFLEHVGGRFQGNAVATVQGEGPTSSLGAAPGHVAAPVGDCEDDPKPEDRLHSRHNSRDPSATMQQLHGGTAL